jgi:TetR/AcrR family transcriptional repressor of nem operon
MEVSLQGWLVIVNHVVQNASMARPVEFDRSKAMNKALVLFWHQGYQATSLSDLLSAMGISRSSFYAAFGDKRSLFIACLDLFAARTRGLLQRARTEMEPMDALQSFFEGNIVDARGGRARPGCMIVNTVLEMSGVDDVLAARAGAHLDEIQGVFKLYIEEAGVAPARASEIAEVLMLFNEGVRVSMRRRLSDAQHKRSIATTFRLIRGAIE